MTRDDALQAVQGALAREGRQFSSARDLTFAVILWRFIHDVRIGDADDLWALELWGQNLTDETYYQVAFAAPFQSGTYDAFMGQPRTVGLTLHLKR